MGWTRGCDERDYTDVLFRLHTLICLGRSHRNKKRYKRIYSMNVAGGVPMKGRGKERSVECNNQFSRHGRKWFLGNFLTALGIVNGQHVVVLDK